MQSSNACMFPSASCPSESSRIQLLSEFPVWGLWIIKIRRKEFGLFYSSIFMANRQSIHMSMQHSLWESSRSFPNTSNVVFYFKRSYVKPSRQFSAFSCSIKVTDVLGSSSMGLKRRMIKNSLVLLKGALEGVG